MKHKLLLISSFICYYLGIDSLFYRLNRKSKRIITFHNVLPSHLLPLGKSIGMVDDVETFSKILREVRKRYAFSTDFADLHTATITFDDGYKNQVEVACPIMTEISSGGGIVFICNELRNNTNYEKSLIIDLLLHWTHLSPDGCYKINNHNFEITPDNRDNIWSTVIWPAFCEDSDSKGETLLNELKRQCSLDKIFAICSDEYLRLRLTGITDEDISHLKERGVMVGWHTVSHYPLSRLSRSEKVREIDCPFPEMKTLPFSYPYGETCSVDEESKDIVSRMGYPYAVSNSISGGRRADKYFLPRMSLSSDRYLLHFELSGLKYFLQHRALLPRTPLS